MENKLTILKRDSLHLGGFAGLKEHQLVKSPDVFGPHVNDDGSWKGMGRFVYLADARFMPHGETRMHRHHEVDVISVMVEGSINHAGSLKHGERLTRDTVQVQRAGGEGFSHNEINPDNEWNRMIQLWVLPEIPGQAADYKLSSIDQGKLNRIYGGNAENKIVDAIDVENQVDFPAQTMIDVTVLDDKQMIEVRAPFLAYITRGQGLINGVLIEEGDLVKGDAINFIASADDVQLIIIH